MSEYMPIITEPKGPAEAKAQNEQSHNQWLVLLKNVGRDMYSGWVPNYVVSIILALFGPAIGLLMNTQKAIIIGVASGLTIAIWATAFIFLRHVPSGPLQPVQPRQTEQPEGPHPEPIRREMSYQLSTLEGLIKQMGISEMWLSQIFVRGPGAFDGIPAGRGLIDYPAAIREMASRDQVEILETAKRQYKDFFGEVFSEDIRFRIKQQKK